MIHHTIEELIQAVNKFCGIEEMVAKTMTRESMENISTLRLQSLEKRIGEIISEINDIKIAKDKK